MSCPADGSPGSLNPPRIVACDDVLYVAVPVVIRKRHWNVVAAFGGGELDLTGTADRNCAVVAHQHAFAIVLHAVVCRLLATPILGPRGNRTIEFLAGPLAAKACTTTPEEDVLDIAQDHIALKAFFGHSV